MRHTTRTRRLAALLTGAAALLTGCTAAAAPTSGRAAPCDAYAAFQGHKGTTVSVFTPIRGAEADQFRKSWQQFSDCTGIRIADEGSDTFEEEITKRVDAGRAPDVALVPQPGLVATLAERGALRPAVGDVATSARRNFPSGWLDYGTVAGKLYATPLDANIKGFVWYSPSLFRRHGWSVPRTWDEMTDLTSKIASSGTTPWCVGIESGVATGWPVTDWVEDVLLRAEGPEVYDAWVGHDIAFDDARVAAATDRVGAILKDSRLAGDGAGGGADAIAETPYQVAGQRLLEGGCAMHKQSSSFATQWPPNTKIGDSGDVAAFPLPPLTAGAAPSVVVGGHFVVGLQDRPEVQAVRAYLADPLFADSRAGLGNWVSPNTRMDASLLPGPTEKKAAELLRQPGAAVRFDGSDLMPSKVGAGSFWSGMTRWIRGADTDEVLRDIEASWPDKS